MEVRLRDGAARRATGLGPFGACVGPLFAGRGRATIEGEGAPVGRRGLRRTAADERTIMGFLDNAQEMLDKGVSAAKGAVSGVAVEQQAFAKAFVRLCADGWGQGWHEGNGGNLSYRLAPEDVASCRSFFYDNPSSWVPLGVQVDGLRGEFLMVTAAGAHLRAVPLDPRRRGGHRGDRPLGRRVAHRLGLQGRRGAHERACEPCDRPRRAQGGHRRGRPRALPCASRRRRGTHERAAARRAHVHRALCGRCSWRAWWRSRAASAWCRGRCREGPPVAAGHGRGDALLRCVRVGAPRRVLPWPHLRRGVRAHARPREGRGRLCERCAR